MNRSVILACAWGAAVVLCVPADEPKKPQGQRVLAGDDAKAAEKLRREIDDAHAGGDYAKAIAAGEKLLALRKKVQGDDHFQTVNLGHEIMAYRRVADLSAEKRQAWRTALVESLESRQAETKGRYADALPKRQTYLKMCREVLGDEHPDTAAAYSDVARNLERQQKFADALPLRKSALAIRTKVLGERHPDTANSCDETGFNLQVQDKIAEALPLYQKALEINRHVFGEEHARTADSYTSLGYIISAQKRYADAAPVFLKALEINRKLFGEHDETTADSYHNVGNMLHIQGLYAESQPYFQKALDGYRKAFGEKHHRTARGYTDLAKSLNAQAKYADAHPLYQKALEIRREARGADHPDTADSYRDLADNLNGQGKFAEAQPLYDKALDIYRTASADDDPMTIFFYTGAAGNLKAQRQYAKAQAHYETALKLSRKIFGDVNDTTANAYAFAALNLHAQGKYAEAQPYLEKALDAHRKVHGETHFLTPLSYSNLALNLDAQGKYAEGQALLQKALELNLRIHGEQNGFTALSYNNLAASLNRQGKHAESVPLHQKSLAIRRAVHGEEHPDTALSYNNIASTLLDQGKQAEALSMHQKALEIRRKAFGEEHIDVAVSYNNVAASLNALGRHAEAQPLYEKALEINRKVRGEEHPETALSYNNVAFNLSGQGRHADAIPFQQKALDIRKRALGPDHPDTATSYSNLALDLQALRKYDEAQPLARSALDTFRRVFGEGHPYTTQGYGNAALILAAQSKHTDARPLLERAVRSYEAGRLAMASGIDRAALATVNPSLLLAVLQRAERPGEAWHSVELALARGLLDQGTAGVGPAMTPDERAEHATLRQRVAVLQPQIAVLVAQLGRTKDEAAALDKLLQERRAAEERLAAIAVAVSRRQVAAADAIRKAIPADAALLFWVDVGSTSGDVEEHWACAVRSAGEPKWERLPGTGPGGKWSAADAALPDRLRAALAGAATFAEVAALAEQLRKQRIGPVLKHLDGVRSLHVVPVDRMAGVPVELLAPDRVVSYVPSGTFLARAKDRAPPAGQKLLALGDPIFEVPGQKLAAPKALPPGGLLVTQVLPESTAAKARLQAGDVLLKYGAAELKDFDGLKAAVAANEKKASIAVTVWREDADEPFVRDVGPGRLGVVVALDPAPVAIANRRKADALVRSVQRGGWKELPGTRVETDRLRQLRGEECKVLVDGAASEQELEALRKSGELSKFRYLHFATHGEGNAAYAFESALILAQDKLPRDAAPRVGEPYLNGQLSAAEVLAFWKLDAELVTLSACETAVGKASNGEGALGFAQAFLSAGSRGVCLSLWKVDDTATALLMDRFYSNLFGQRAGLKGPMGKAAALDEAKRWLRGLPADEALTLTAKLTKGVARGTRDKGVELRLAPAPDPTAPGKGDRPFAHPRYWAGFVLIGDPN